MQTTLKANFPHHNELSNINTFNMKKMNFTDSNLFVIV